MFAAVSNSLNILNWYVDVAQIRYVTDIHPDLGHMAHDGQITEWYLSSPSRLVIKWTCFYQTSQFLMEAVAGLTVCQAVHYCNVAVLDKCRQKCSLIYVIKWKHVRVETATAVKTTLMTVSLSESQSFCNKCTKLFKLVLHSIQSDYSPVFTPPLRFLGVKVLKWLSETFLYLTEVAINKLLAAGLQKMHYII